MQPAESPHQEAMRLLPRELPLNFDFQARTDGYSSRAFLHHNHCLMHAEATNDIVCLEGLHTSVPQTLPFPRRRGNLVREKRTERRTHLIFLRMHFLSLKLFCPRIKYFQLCWPTKKADLQGGPIRFLQGSKYCSLRAVPPPLFISWRCTPSSLQTPALVS